jgi:N-acetylmuramoyl-L-alanine amidase
MAIMPGAVWNGDHSSRRPMARYDAVVVHTIVGYAPAHAAHFSTKADGTIIQSRDTVYQSAACLHGNPRIIAIENEDHGGPFPDWTGSNVPPLTGAQVEANARILRWAHEVHGIPLQRCPDSRPGSRGLAYHRQGIDGNWSGYRHPGRVSGGEVWTESYGKVCPGDNRIDQLDDILALAKGDEDEVKPEDINAIADEVVRRLLAAEIKVSKDGDTKPLRLLLRQTYNGIGRVREVLGDGGEPDPEEPVPGKR